MEGFCALLDLYYLDNRKKTVSLLHCFLFVSITIMADELNIEWKLAAIEEFVLETLSEFGRRLNRIECQISEEFSEIKKNVSFEIQNSLSQTEKNVEDQLERMKESLVNKIETDIQRTSTPKRSASASEQPELFVLAKKMRMDKDQIPKTIDDIQDQSLSSELKPFSQSVKYVKEKEKLTPVQLYYVHYWISKKKIITGNYSYFNCILYPSICKIWPIISDKRT